MGRLMAERTALSAAFVARAGWGGAGRAFLAGDASARSYDRLTGADGRTAVLMDAPPDKGEDVVAFTRIARHLSGLGLSAPAVLAQDSANGFLLIEDLGDALFARLLATDPAREAQLYAAATDVLVHLQSHAPAPGLPVYDTAAMAEAVAPAVQSYAAAVTGRDADPAPLQRAMGATLASLAPEAGVMMLRDYHAENLLWLPDRAGLAHVGLLDFQQAMLGHPAYDLVSLLQDARRDVAAQTQDAMIARFAAARGLDAPAFRAACAAQGAQRNLRILGIFTRLALTAGKPRYLALIPRVWGHVQRNLSHPGLNRVAQVVADLVPAPTPDALERIARQCPTP